MGGVARRMGRRARAKEEKMDPIFGLFFSAAVVVTVAVGVVIPSTVRAICRTMEKWELECLEEILELQGAKRPAKEWPVLAGNPN